MIESKKLNLLNNSYAPQSMIADAEIFNTIPKDKIANFIEWSSNNIIKNTTLEECQWHEIAPTFGLQGGGEAYSASRLVAVLLFSGSELTKTELECDLETLGFKKEKIGLIISTFEPKWTTIAPVLKRRRLEAIPKLFDIRWRVDVRYASSNYLKEPEVVAILRVGTFDGERKNHMHLEMTLERLSWLESIIVELKNEMLQAQQKIVPK